MILESIVSIHRYVDILLEYTCYPMADSYDNVVHLTSATFI